MFFLRLLGKCLLFAAFIALAYDGARILATPSEGLLLTSLSTHLKTYVPQGRESVEHFFLDHGPAYLWSSVVEPLLVLPVSLLLGVLGAALFMAGYRRPPPEIVTD
jgi:hypothetical protein